MYGRAADCQHAGSLFFPALVQVVSLPEGERDCKPSPGSPVLVRNPLGGGVPEGSPGVGGRGLQPSSSRQRGLSSGCPLSPCPRRQQSCPRACSGRAGLGSASSACSRGREEGNEHPSQGKGSSFTRSGTAKETSKTKYKKPPLESSRPCFVRFLFYFLVRSGAVRSGVQGKLWWRAGAVQCCVMSPGAAFQNRKDAEFSPEQKSGVNALTY